MKNDAMAMESVRFFIRSKGYGGTGNSPMSNDEVFKTLVKLIEARKAFIAPHIRYLRTSPYVEVLICDRAGYASSGFGHVAMVINETAYSQGHDKITEEPADDYMYRNRFRDVKGFVLSLNTSELNLIRQCWKERMRKNAPYFATDNNCTTAVQEALSKIGIDVKQPIGDFPVQLLKIMNGFVDSGNTRIRDVRLYPRGWTK